ncbi:unnamed protein product [Amoebophrya sp. A25]|nr:unnamed protein product [Amoebophrya sp. A25]|eukprot:GSA25T00009811001.1
MFAAFSFGGAKRGAEGPAAAQKTDESGNSNEGKIESQDAATTSAHDQCGEKVSTSAATETVNQEQQQEEEDPLSAVGGPTLFSYQKDGVAWMRGVYNMRKGGILGDEMGLGKTVQALSFLQQTPEIHVGLLLCPVTVVHMWMREAKKWAPRFKPICLRLPPTLGQRRAKLAIQKKFSTGLFRRYLVPDEGAKGPTLGDASSQQQDQDGGLKSTASKTRPNKKTALLFIGNIEILVSNPDLLSEIKVQKDLLETEFRFLFKKRLKLLEKHQGDDLMQDFGAVDPDEQEDTDNESAFDEEDSDQDDDNSNSVARLEPGSTGKRFAPGPFSTQKKRRKLDDETAASSPFDDNSRSRLNLAKSYPTPVVLEDAMVGGGSYDVSAVGSSSSAAVPSATRSAVTAMPSSSSTAASGRALQLRTFRQGARYDWDVVIVDEAHRCKEPGGKASRNLRLVRSVSKFLLTGTPLQNEVRDLWNLHDICNPGILGNLQSFQRNYAGPISKGMLKNAGELEVELKNELAQQLQERTRPYYLQRTKAQVKNMGEVTKTDVVLWLRPTEEQIEFYKKVLANASFIRDARQHGKLGAVVFKAITYLKKVSNTMVLCHPDFTTPGSWVDYVRELQEEVKKEIQQKGQDKATTPGAAIDGASSAAVLNGREDSKMPREPRVLKSEQQEEQPAFATSSKMKTICRPQAVAGTTTSVAPFAKGNLSTTNGKSIPNMAAGTGGAEDEFFDIDSDPDESPIREDESDDGFLSSDDEKRKAKKAAAAAAGTASKDARGCTSAVGADVQEVPSTPPRKAVAGQARIDCTPGEAAAKVVASPLRRRSGSLSPIKMEKDAAASIRPRRSSALALTANESALVSEGAVTKTRHLPTLRDEAVKLAFLAQFLPHLVQQGHRVLLFSGSTKMLDILMSAVLKPLQLKCLRIDGTTDVEARNKKVERFQAEKSPFPVFLASTQVGGVGLTLTAADRVIIVDPSWNPSTDHQAIDRAFRVGQRRNVVAYRLIATGLIEEKMFRYQVFKQGLAKSCLTTTTTSTATTTTSSSAQMNQHVMKEQNLFAPGAVARTKTISADSPSASSSGEAGLVFMTDDDAELELALARAPVVEQQARYFSDRDISDLFEFLEPEALDTCKRLETEHGRPDKVWEMWRQDAAPIAEIATTKRRRPRQGMDDEDSDPSDEEEVPLAPDVAKRRKLDDGTIRPSGPSTAGAAIEQTNAKGGCPATTSIKDDIGRLFGKFVLGLSDYSCLFGAPARTALKLENLKLLEDAAGTSPLDNEDVLPSMSARDQATAAQHQHAHTISSSSGAPLPINSISGNASSTPLHPSSSSTGPRVPIFEQKRRLADEVKAMNAKKVDSSFRRQEAEKAAREAKTAVAAAEQALRDAVEGSKTRKQEEKAAKQAWTEETRRLDEFEKNKRAAERGVAAAENTLKGLKQALDTAKRAVETARQKETAKKAAAEEYEKKFAEKTKLKLSAAEQAALDETENRQVELEVAEKGKERDGKRTRLDNQVEKTKNVLHSAGSKQAAISFEKMCKLSMSALELQWEREQLEKRAEEAKKEVDDFEGPAPVFLQKNQERTNENNNVGASSSSSSSSTGGSFVLNALQNFGQRVAQRALGKTRAAVASDDESPDSELSRAHKKLREEDANMQAHRKTIEAKRLLHVAATTASEKARQDEEKRKADLAEEKEKSKMLLNEIKESREAEKVMIKELEAKTAEHGKLEKKLQIFEERKRQGMKDLMREKYDENQVEKLAKKK